MATTGTQLRQLLRKNVVASEDSTGDTLSDATIGQHPVAGRVVKSGADAAAGTAYRFVLDPSTATAALVQSASVVVDTAVTANATNFATIALVYNDGAGGADTTIGTLDTSTTGFTAKVARTLTLTAANVLIPASRQVEWVVTKANAGVSLATTSFVLKAALA